MLFTIVVAILSTALVWGGFHVVQTISDQVRFRNLMVWLEMDEMIIAKRMEDKNLDGLAQDMAMKFRERSHLFLFKVERTLKALIAEGHLAEEYAESMWPLIKHVRELLSNTDPFEVPELIIDEMNEDLPEEVHKRLGPLVRESKLFSRKSSFFFAWLERSGCFHTESKDTE